jgi:hypothetical protein
MLTVDASDVGVGAEWNLFLKLWQRSVKIIHNWKKMTCLIEAIMMYISSIRDAYWSQ